MNEALNILVVEDNDIDAEFLRCAFERNNIKNAVYRAYNGQEALEIMRGENGRKKIADPFIVLIDINIPPVNGFDILQELRNDETLKKTIVFVLTTSSRSEELRKANELGVVGYFLKKDTAELAKLLSLVLNA